MNERYEQKCFPLKGKVITCSLSTMSEYEAELKYFIVLRPGKVKLKDARHRPDLAPSHELFSWAREHMNTPGWFEHYAKVFRHDMLHREGLKRAISEVEKLAQTKAVMLICFCPCVDMCHRGLIADELMARGVDVIRA